MRFDPPLEEGVLTRRYKRFLADIVTRAGLQRTIHCPNTGAMLGCSEPGSRIWYSTSSNPKRKYPNTLEIVENRRAQNIGVHSALANALVEEAFYAGVIEEFRGYSTCRREVVLAEQTQSRAGEPAQGSVKTSRGRSSRIDFVFDGDEQSAACYVEVKSLTLEIDSGLGAFPDAVSERARKHVQALSELVGQGHRGVLFFCVQHSGVNRVTVAASIDPEYAAEVRRARDLGVEVLAYAAGITPAEIRLTHSLPVLL